MKRCPECRRDYYDETLLYCLDDGTPLLEGPASAGNEHSTKILHDTAAPGESETAHQVHITDRTRDIRTANIPAASSGRTSKLLLGVGSLALIAATAAGGYVWYRSSSPSGTRLGSNMKMTRLVTGVDGRPGRVSITRDGKYVAYALVQDRGQSLWLRQVSQNASLQIVPPGEEDFYSGTAFSPAGDLIYFVKGNRKTDPRGSLYEMPVLGGTAPRKILDWVPRAISLSPDGKQVTFVRPTENGETAVILAGLDGYTPERTLAKRSGDSWFIDSAWSPDGKTIAVSGATVIGGTASSFVTIDIETGEERPLGATFRGELDPPRWRPDGKSLLITLSERPGARYQIYTLSYPAGELTRITNDTNDYFIAESTADGGTIVTTVGEVTRRLWTVEVGNPEKSAKQITSGIVEGTNGIAILADGRAAFASERDDARNLWIVGPDGSGLKQLTTGLDTVAAWPAASPDGKTIFFGSQRPDWVPHIWRVNADGTDLRQVTTYEDYNPSVSPDGKWLAFNSFRGGQGIATIWKMPVEGGEAIQLTKYKAHTPIFSPDGRTLLCWYTDENISPPRVKPAIINPENGEIIKIFDGPLLATNLTWSADGKSILYYENKAGVGNIFSQPVDGGSTRQLTKFTSDQISRFAISPDGRTLVISRGTSQTEIVLIKDFR